MPCRRGILFHGEPGTGKTLAARALAGACAKASPQPVAFFARKGADCLGKFSGEAERTLRLLFEEVPAMQYCCLFNKQELWESLGQPQTFPLCLIV